MSRILENARARLAVVARQRPEVLKLLAQLLRMKITPGQGAIHGPLLRFPSMEEAALALKRGSRVSMGLH
jgi:hypothetical protein